MDKLKELLKKCKCGVYLTINAHRDYYLTVEKRLKELAQHECPPEIEHEVKQKMIELDTLINIQFYPATPIGSYSVYHWDLDTALDIALSCLADEPQC